ncbi:MAG: hypothetical protein DWQ47_16675 [Acidobacteria bacterium]|nr:MAG: hypothetical protein DWQ32_04075 [Acidobacteriota bacterium]REK02320.1 MAG: hypothetical protein DWQ38_08075 [Acidobacteriota bacterium]REK13877.1 MAG: hypothetical protein DWQ43_09765 [Acidobacteriota bacterium]REK41871.1 MAG: hypothetical protein DWQ47_16675 [Acidobacteriota bacterium]
MMIFEIVKRALPFTLALAVGILLAYPFAAATTTVSTSDHYNADKELLEENYRLRKENCEMKRQITIRGERDEFIFELDVPEPPMPPVAPEPPLPLEAPPIPDAPVAPEAPAARPSRN